MPRTRLARWIDGLLEFCWLFILIGVPVFFNVRDYRVFEPDKVVLLRNTVLVMLVLVLIKTVYVAPYYLARWSGLIEGQDAISVRADLAAGFKKRPIVIVALIFAVIYLLATFHSILPSISFWGSYDRMEGTYTYLSYITLFLLVLAHIKTWRQVERIVSAVILASVPVAAYSWLQHFNADPLIWAANGETANRTPSTLGNPIFLAAYLLMAVPFTMHRLVHRVRILMDKTSTDSSTDLYWHALSAVGYASTLGLQLGGVGFSGSRGPALGLLAALIVFGLAIAVRRRITWLLRLTAISALAIVCVFAATNTVMKSGDTPGAGFTRFLHLLPSESGSSEVRSLLWKSSLSLVKEHPLLGCGPEVLIFCWYPHYPSELRQVELANAAPDRSHDEEIDIILTSGILGEIAYLAFLGLTLGILGRLVMRAKTLQGLTLASALLAAFLGHIVEGATGIAFSATLSLIWVIAALATALDAGALTEAGASFTRASESDVTSEVVPPLASVAGDSNARVERRPGRNEPRTNRRKRDDRGRGPQRLTEARRFGYYSAGSTLGRLDGVGMALMGMLALVTAAIVVLALALFVSNIQVIQADVSYRVGQNYETAAGQIVNQPGQYQSALLTYQAAISAYRDALNEVPSWNDPPPQDTYYLFLGKALLEYADALRKDTTGTVTPAQVTDVLNQALSVFQTAAKANPLNPDHPRNIGKLYNFWGTTVFRTQDVSKLILADQAFAKAHSLAPHNSDILDEWAVLDMSIGNADAKQAHQRYAEALDHLQLARSLFPESGAVYRDLGTAYAMYAAFATNSHMPANALMYEKLQRDAWLTALRYAAPQHEKIYPRLAELFRATFHDRCNAGQYALFGLQAIHSNALADPNGALAASLQNMITTATTGGCHLTGQ